jgi:DNA-binding HxlR family transcriptional regulator
MLTIYNLPKPLLLIEDNLRREEFLRLLRKLSKKGFYDALLFIKSKGTVHYAEVLDYCMKNRVVDSRATVTIVLNGLTDLGLVNRMVSQTRPVRTSYQLTEKGKKILEYLEKIESI